MILDVAFSRLDPACRSASGRAVAVIDVIRATTTITMALHHGCAGVIPVRTLSEAMALARRLDGGALLAGERNAEKAKGCELGNSPTEYGRPRIKDKTIVLTTTNGTRTFQAVTEAQAIIACSFLNVTAAARWLTNTGLDILIVCAGRQGRFCLEDVVGSGILIDRLLSISDRAYMLSDSARTARQLFATYQNDLLGMLRDCEWGKEIIRKGFEADLEICAHVDLTDIVPVMREGRLVAERP
ncbi:MAG: 2-phosphosulfolactate phosphatase [bacterium]|uniref:Probable 2-phosphosulfolactate phosphatase n=1 Tax=Candidatus Methylomirabilis tolerans TaxID=3123416 RepID=A0AAJ1EKF1_9BACT|nr:2-phosphosulfolactate phosphatase [Candidatus Methylomirabilis sp.]